MTPIEQNAERFKALGHPLRLFILRLVVQGPEGGTPAGEIQERVGIPASTLSHHLACLASTQLLRVEREGTTLRYRADFPTLHTLTDYLWQDCCSGGQGSAEVPTPCCPSGQ
ncbi:MAG: Transcriptional regulator, ArsR family protein [Holophagaceae bacterium]|nr:Transcriptional regulator, ArsR family protein [Holophagaceae bacterium]